MSAAIAKYFRCCSFWLLFTAYLLDDALFPFYAPVPTSHKYFTANKICCFIHRPSAVAQQRRSLKVFLSDVRSLRVNTFWRLCSATYFPKQLHRRASGWNHREAKNKLRIISYHFIGCLRFIFLVVKIFCFGMIKYWQLRRLMGQYHNELKKCEELLFSF